MSLAPETTEPKPAAGTTRPPGRSVLASDLRIVGDLIAEGAVEIMGEVEGSVKARTLMLAQDGRLSGTISAETVELKGQMQGAVSCQTLTLRSAATVQADIVYSSLAIESGAQIDGTFRKPKP